MPDYKSMYFRLFNRVSDAINILQSAQQEGENTFIESQDEASLQLIETPKMRAVMFNANVEIVSSQNMD